MKRHNWRNGEKKKLHFLRIPWCKRPHKGYTGVLNNAVGQCGTAHYAHHLAHPPLFYTRFINTASDTDVAWIIQFSTQYITFQNVCYVIKVSLKMWAKFCKGSILPPMHNDTCVHRASPPGTVEKTLRGRSFTASKPLRWCANTDSPATTGWGGALSPGISKPLNKRRAKDTSDNVLSVLLSAAEP